MNVVGRIDADLHSTTTNVDDRDHDLPVDVDGLADFSTEYQHDYYLLESE
jgi:hypothetical protein